jgi:hypothetical protein
MKLLTDCFWQLHLVSFPSGAMEFLFAAIAAIWQSQPRDLSTGAVLDENIAREAEAIIYQGSSARPSHAIA